MVVDDRATPTLYELPAAFADSPCCAYRTASSAPGAVGKA